MGIIKNIKDIQEYKTYNKLYIPEELNNSNYQYRFNGDYINVITNRNCYNQYNNTYCDCITYNWKINVIGGTNSCNNSYSTTNISYNYITSDINYSKHIRDNFIEEKNIIFLIFILAIIFFIALVRRR